MRLTIDHRTIYRFSAPQGRLTQMLRLTPEDTHDQAVADWQLHVDCDARMRPGRDGFGNRITMLYVEGPIDQIEISVAGEVLTNVSKGIVHGAHEPLPPALFLRSTALTEGNDALADFAAEAVAALSDPVEQLHALNGAIHRNLRSIAAARFLAEPLPRPLRSKPSRRAIWRRSSAPPRGGWMCRRAMSPAIARSASRAMHAPRRMAGPRPGSRGSAGWRSIPVPASRRMKRTHGSRLRSI